ncbi:MAG: GNAT family N-acetyltransferase [Chitinophagaceae bacterium]|nr:GNAT family N-acetyltransferase [Chitinophagaceae bacterium]
MLKATSPVDEPVQQLDNPAWHALASVHSTLSLGNDMAKRYIPGVVSFAGLKSPDAGSANMLDALLSAGESFFIIGDLPPLIEGWKLKSELVCAQMVCPQPVAAAPATDIAEQLTERDKIEMFNFIHAIQPGYYLPDTPRMGNYFGIRQSGKLVAMAGERMCLNGFTELSAICTHPDFTGRQYAQQLIQKLIFLHQSAGIVPFLHVAKSNQRAISLYEYMGFRLRRYISFWLIHKAGHS